MKRIYLRVAVLGFMAALLPAGCGKKQEMTPVASPPAPPIVVVAEATQAEAPVFSEAIATLEGSSSTPILSQVSGYLIKQAYQEGATVKAGDLLFLIDTRPSQVGLDKAKSDPGNIRITSPMAGVAGRAIPGVGDWISPGMTLTTVSTVDPMAAVFALPEKFYRDNSERMAQVSFELVQADGTPYPLKGKFDHIELAARSSSGVITVYALFSNPDGVLRPGQYAKVHGVTARIEGAVLVPQRAVSGARGIDQVMVVKPDDTIEVRDVTTGDRAGSFWVVTSGLKTGERVVVEGMEKCQAGERVTPQMEDKKSN